MINYCVVQFEHMHDYRDGCGNKDWLININGSVYSHIRAIDAILWGLSSDNVARRDKSFQIVGALKYYGW